jgi:hypothetical protein
MDERLYALSMATGGVDLGGRNAWGTVGKDALGLELGRRGGCFASPIEMSSSSLVGCECDACRDATERVKCVSRVTDCGRSNGPSEGQMMRSNNGRVAGKRTCFRCKPSSGIFSLQVAATSPHSYVTRFVSRNRPRDEHLFRFVNWYKRTFYTQITCLISGNRSKRPPNSQWPRENTQLRSSRVPCTRAV